MTTPTPSSAAPIAALYPNAAEQQSQVQAPPPAPAAAAPAAPAETVATPGAPEPAPAPAEPAPAPAAAADPAPTDPAAPPAATPPADTSPYSDLGLPDTFKPDDALLGQFRDLAAKANLDPAVAKEFAGLYVKAQEAALASQQAAVQQLTSTWHSEVMAFPEFAPEARDRTTTMVARVMEEFGTPEGRQWLAESGLGNNPHLVRLVLNLTNALMEGEPTPTGTPRPPEQAQGRQRGVRPTAGQLIYGEASSTMTAR